MKNWSVFKDCRRKKSAIVIGNGPSRKGLDYAARIAHTHELLTIACNAYWRESLPLPHALVCYDAVQTEAALAGTRRHRTRIVIPDPKCQETMPAIDRDDESRVYVAAPHAGTETSVSEKWWPTDWAIGAWSGMLAYQLALIAGCDQIYLFGVDCAGVASTVPGEVLLSAVGSAAPGYGPCTVPESVCVPFAKALMPSAWAQQRDLWRVLTDRARLAGVLTWRVTDAGALDWLDVKLPWVP